jgi:GIY-YIG catalytic domain-containing protein
LGARLDGIEEVAGSNPAGSTRISMTFFVYILQSESTGRYYIGQTKNLEERVTYHNANYSKALRNRGPWKLVHTSRARLAATHCGARTTSSGKRIASSSRPW